MKIYLMIISLIQVYLLSGFVEKMFQVAKPVDRVVHGIFIWMFISTLYFQYHLYIRL